MKMCEFEISVQSCLRKYCFLEKWQTDSSDGRDKYHLSVTLLIVLKSKYWLFITLFGHDEQLQIQWTYWPWDDNQKTLCKVQPLFTSVRCRYQLHLHCLGSFLRFRKSNSCQKYMQLFLWLPNHA